MANFLYNPDRKGKEQLIAEFVVRTKVLDDIMHDIETSTMNTPEQHYLLVGQRGTGKTTLLHRIRYAIDDNEKLNKWLIPVIFSEEQYNISELANLWENIAHILEDYHGFAGISKEMELNVAKENFEELCYEILEKYLQNHGKKIVLLIDNLGDLLKKLEENEVRRLREILQTKTYLRLIAGSPFYLDSTLDYTQPLFEFFKVVPLDGLSKEETQELLLKLGETHNEKEKIEKIIKETPGRIETLRILTGGMPRTIALMFTIFVDYEHKNSIKDLEKVLDIVTPLYKHRMDDLPKQQQKIVDAVAMNWEAISVKELTSKVRLESKVISAQLRQLEKNQVIEKRATDTKNHLYLLKERFFNIWYLMRYGRKEKKESVKWLVAFMENWYDECEMDERVDNYFDKIFTNNLSGDNAEFYSILYGSMANLSQKAKLKVEFAVEKREKANEDAKKIDLIRKSYDDENYLEVVKNALYLSFVPSEIKHMIIKSFRTLYFKKNEFKIFSNEVDKFFDENESVSLGASSVMFLLSNTIYLTEIVRDEYEKANDILKYMLGLISIPIEHFGNDFYRKHYKVEESILSFQFLILLSRGQISIVKKLFDENDLQELKSIFMPIYLATTVLEDSNIFATLGDELRGPVQSVFDEINWIKQLENQ